MQCPIWLDSEEDWEAGRLRIRDCDNEIIINIGFDKNFKFTKAQFKYIVKKLMRMSERLEEVSTVKEFIQKHGGYMGAELNTNI